MASTTFVRHVSLPPLSLFRDGGLYSFYVWGWFENYRVPESDAIDVLWSLAPLSVRCQHKPSQHSVSIFDFTSSAHFVPGCCFVIRLSRCVGQRLSSERISARHDSKPKLERKMARMNTRNAKLLVSLVATVITLAGISSAQSVRVNGAATPLVVAPGSNVFVHSSVENLTTTNQAVTVAMTVTNPGECVSAVSKNIGVLAIGLTPRETRLASLSTTIPTSACSGTYEVTITVTSSTGAVLAKHTSTFTVTIP